MPLPPQGVFLSSPPLHVSLAGMPICELPSDQSAGSQTLDRWSKPVNGRSSLQFRLCILDGQSWEDLILKLSAVTFFCSHCSLSFLHPGERSYLKNKSLHLQ
jgi:hypothetical protein